MATEVAIKEVNYNVRCIQNIKSIKLNKEKAKSKYWNFFLHIISKKSEYIFRLYLFS